MSALPRSENSLLVRTTFDDDEKWLSLVASVSQETADGFHAYVELVDNAAFCNQSWQSLRADVLASGGGPAVLFVADTRAIHSVDFEILVISVRDEVEPFRCTAQELWGVDNNLNLANLDWEDFVQAAPDGVFRGFR